MNEDRDVIEFVASGRVELPPAAASRVRDHLLQAELDGPSATAVPRANWSVVTLVAAGIAVAIGVAWLQHQRRSPVAPVAAPVAAPAAPPIPAAQDPARAPELVLPVPPFQEPQAVLYTGPGLSAALTLARAPLVLACDLEFTGADTAAGFAATVAAVVHGGAEWSGRQVWLQRRGVPGATTGSCLDQVVPGTVGTGAGRYLFALTPLPATAPGERPQLAPAFAGELRGVPVHDAPYVRDWEPAPSELQYLRSWLVATATRSPAATQRYHALSALGAFDGGGEPGPDSPWLDAATTSLLVRLAYDVTDAVRERVACFLPQAIRVTAAGMPADASGADVDEALRALRFDRSAAVRERLRERCRAASWSAEEEPGDLWFHGLARSAWFAAWTRAIVTRSHENGVTDEIAVWRLEINKGIDHVMAAALGLAAAKDRSAAVTLLRELTADRRPAVAALAAGGLVKHGDNEGYEVLRRMVAGADADAASYALDIVRDFTTPAALAVTRTAADHRHPAIRARACAALRELRSLAPQDVDAAIVALGNDAHELVRIAAGTEPMVVTPPWQRPWANALQYWREVRGLR